MNTCTVSLASLEKQYFNTLVATLKYRFQYFGLEQSFFKEADQVMSHFPKLKSILEIATAIHRQLRRLSSKMPRTKVNL